MRLDLTGGVNGRGLVFTDGTTRPSTLKVKEPVTVYYNVKDSFNSVVEDLRGL